MDKRFLGILAAIAVVLTGIFIMTNSDKAGAPNNAVRGTLTNHVRGQGTSGVKLTEYGDFQCPACAQYYPIVEQVVEKYEGQIHFQFRNFPLSQIHPNAVAASRAAEAADLQGKFWEMYNVLYQNQTSWGPSSNPLTVFTSYAKQLGMDTNKFSDDFKSRQVNDRVQADLQEGTRLKLTGTPSFLINDKKISTPDASVEAFSRVIEAAIRQKTGKAPEPTPNPQPAEAQTDAPAGTPAQQ